MRSRCLTSAPARRHPEVASLALDEAQAAHLAGHSLAMHVSVVWGTGNEARSSFRYRDGISAMARYSIGGTSLNDELGLVEVTER